MTSFKAALCAGLPLLCLAAACSDSKSTAQNTPAPATQATPASAGTPMTTTTIADAPPQGQVQVATAPDLNLALIDMSPIAGSAAVTAQPILTADWRTVGATPEARRNALIRAEVLLSRAHFSPGVIDGQDGGNLKNAIAAYETANQLPADGKMNEPVWSALGKDPRPALTDYVITAEDVQGPFLSTVPKDMAEMAKLPALSFTGPVQELAQRFHMDEGLLKALNPGADFSAAGTSIVVAAVGPEKLAMPVTRIEVDKTLRQVRAYGAADILLAVYPATVGSAERPAPSGDWAVRAVASNPTYTFDPSRLTFGKASEGKLTIKPGPNNPVGSTWIDLTKDTYGIHGTPDPRMVGKAASHGCVRLTNWDVRQLSLSVKKGTKVDFVGGETSKAPKAV
jgi:lipoprotein-anchoring transpeptidase ErfK/SrfK